jgi:hypothetical protein
MLLLGAGGPKVHSSWCKRLRAGGRICAAHLAALAAAGLLLLLLLLHRPAVLAHSRIQCETTNYE